MTMATAQTDFYHVEDRARKSLGTSSRAIYHMVERALKSRSVSGGIVLDIGCGQGLLHSFISSRFERYVGVDAVKYETFPPGVEFQALDLDSGRVGFPDSFADVVVAVETIEHLENPRSFMRELVRLLKPGGWLIVTTPNQLSLLSLLTLATKKRFSSFQDVHYPAHLTALLESDLQRIGRECGLVDLNIEYSLRGRVPLTASHYARPLSRLFPRALSDNLLIVGMKA